MGIFSGAWNVATNAIGAAEFGTKGVIIGAGVGLGTELLISQIGDEDDKNSVGTQFKRGFVSGSVASAFSTFQEQYAFKYPNRIQALTSINTTTSASAVIDIADDLLSKNTFENLKYFAKNTYKDIKERDKTGKKISEIAGKRAFTDLMSPITKNINTYMRPENIMFDIVKQSMITGEDLGQDVLKALNPLYGGFSDEQYEKYKTASSNEKDFAKLFKKDYGMKLSSEDYNNMIKHIGDKDLLFDDIRKRILNAEPKESLLAMFNGMKSLGEDTLKGTITAGDGKAKSQWLNTTEDVVIPEKKIQVKTLKENYDGVFNGKDEYELKDIILKETKINKEDSMQKRMAKFLDRNRYYSDTILDKLNTLNKGTKTINVLDNISSDIGNIKVNDVIDFRNINNFIKKGISGALKGIDLNNLKDLDLSNLKELKNLDLDNIENFKKIFTNLKESGFNPINEEGIKDIKRKINGLKSNGIYNTDGLIKYISNIEPGAIGTHKELASKATNTKRKILSTIYEEKHGAPLWARSVEKQIKDGEAKILDNIIVNRNGKSETIPFNNYKKLKNDEFVKRVRTVEGGSKLKRGLAILGDIAIGGLAQGLMFAAPALITSPFRNGGSDKRINNIRSNNAINPVY